MRKAPKTAIDALFGKARLHVLALFFMDPNERFYLREVARRTRLPLSSVQNELRLLTATGVLRSESVANLKYFTANRDSPIFTELQGVVKKTFGLGDVLRNALARAGNRIILAFVFGSFARGEQARGSDVDLCVVGTITSSELSDLLAPAEKILGREISVVAYPEEEFRKKRKQGYAFLKEITAGEKIWLIGDERELRSLA